MVNRDNVSLFVQPSSNVRRKGDRFDAGERRQIELEGVVNMRDNFLAECLLKQQSPTWRISDLVFVTIVDIRIQRPVVWCLFPNKETLVLLLQH